MVFANLSTCCDIGYGKPEIIVCINRGKKRPFFHREDKCFFIKLTLSGQIQVYFNLQIIAPLRGDSYKIDNNYSIGG